MDEMRGEGEEREREREKRVAGGEEERVGKGSRRGMRERKEEGRAEGEGKGGKREGEKGREKEDRGLTQCSGLQYQEIRLLILANLF